MKEGHGQLCLLTLLETKVFIGDEKKEQAKHTNNNIVAKQNEKRKLHGPCKLRN